MFRNWLFGYAALPNQFHLNRSESRWQEEILSVAQYLEIVIHSNTAIERANVGCQYETKVAESE